MVMHRDSRAMPSTTTTTRRHCTHALPQILWKTPDSSTCSPPGWLPAVLASRWLLTGGSGPVPCRGSPLGSRPPPEPGSLHPPAPHQYLEHLGGPLLPRLLPSVTTNGRSQHHDPESPFFDVNKSPYNEENPSRSWSSALEGRGNGRDMVALRSVATRNVLNARVHLPPAIQDLRTHSLTIEL